MNQVTAYELTASQKELFSNFFYNYCGFDDRGYVAGPWGHPWLWTGTVVTVDTDNLQKSAEAFCDMMQEEIAEYFNGEDKDVD